MQLEKILAMMLVSVCGIGSGAMSQEKLMIPSLDVDAAKVSEVLGYWFPAMLSPAKTSAPALVLLHGCGGTYNKSGEFSTRTKSYIELFRQQGWHVLILDSFTTRKVKEICTQQYDLRSVHTKQRRYDVYSALDWLAKQPHVNANKLALVGWSNGGSTVLSATNVNNDNPIAKTINLKAAVAFYPGCKTYPHYRTKHNLLVLIGAADDWTPAAPCVELQAEQSDKIQLAVYPDAYHGFDTTSTVRLRKDVPNGVNPGQGVHVGGHPGAFEAAKKRVIEFLRQELD